jgi:flavin-dependent dehydrogenase
MKTDVVIVGGGPAGSASAMFLAKEGIRSVIVEKQPFPRYHIGESLTGECGRLLRELGLESKMLALGFPQKRGVKVYGPDGIGSWFVPVKLRDANGALQEQFTWQVRRSEFDKMLLDEAIARGATLVQGQATKVLKDDEDKVCGLMVRLADGQETKIEAEVVLDCSGQATFLAQREITGPKYLGSYDRQIAIFSQVARAVRDEGDTADTCRDNTLIFYRSKFHWSWFIPLDKDVVSVGVVAPAAYYLDKKESKRDYLIRELYALNPELKRRLPDIELIEDVHVIPNYSFQVKRFCGKGFLCIGDSHRFVDPIFSFGLFVAMKEAQLAAPVIRAYLEGTGRDLVNPFAEHQLKCEQGIDILEDMIDLFWEQPFAFALLVHRKYTEYMVDTFAGRIYDGYASPAIAVFRNMLKRERAYDNEDLYSVPIGSRYNPERAPLWQADSLVAGTEEWIYSG